MEIPPENPKEIFVFICEDRDTAKKIIKQHLSKTGVSYAQLFPESKRGMIVEALDKIDEHGRA